MYFLLLPNKHTDPGTSWDLNNSPGIESRRKINQMVAAYFGVGSSCFFLHIFSCLLSA